MRKSLGLFVLLTSVLTMLTTPAFLFGSYLPRVQVANAAPSPIQQPWYPAGPTMDNLNYLAYTDSTAELTALQSGSIDIPDAPLRSSIVSQSCGLSRLLCTPPIPDGGYFELQFHLANDYWGCQMNFGNSACGTNIRQAFAHGLDKTSFVANELNNAGTAIDNPVPASVNLMPPNPCAWDSLHLQTGPNCVVGSSSGGTAYHLAAASIGSGCTNTPSLSYTPGCGTPDFCAAADHLIAAGLATGKNSSTCVLTGVSSSITSNPVNVFTRSDDTRRLHMGQSYTQFICALFTGTFSLGCGVAPSTTDLVTYVAGPPSSFPGICPPGITCTTLSLNWWVYTGGFGDINSIDQSLYFIYNSQFVNGIPSIKPPCSNLAVPTSSPSNYMYLCNANYDTSSSQLEFAPCLSAPGDPAPGQPTPTFANCPSTSQLSATSAAYQAQDLFGQNAFTIPVWTDNNVFAYLSNWQRVVVHQRDGFIPPGNIFAEFNAYSPNPAVPGTIRQGYSESARSVNPFVASTLHDLGLVDNIWESPLRMNPSQPGSTLDWMNLYTTQLSPSELSYTPPPGTVAAFRFALRGDMFWQSGQRVTPWDLAFSYVAFKATGVAEGVGLAPITGVKVISTSQVDVTVSNVGVFSLNALGSTIVIPGRIWSSCGASAWDSGANMNFASANVALTPCIAPASSVTSSGAILPNATAVDQSKISPSYDPIAAGTLIGSGPWECTGPTSGAGCSSCNCGNVPVGGSYTFQRYGIGHAPATSLNVYFRSSGNTALWTWTGNTGSFNRDFVNFAQAAFCFGKTPVPTNCTQWSMGIGNPTGSASAPVPIGIAQVSIIFRFLGVNWVAPFDWRTQPPQGIAGFAPVLYEGSLTLNPASIVGCNLSYNNGGGYDC